MSDKEGSFKFSFFETSTNDASETTGKKISKTEASEVLVSDLNKLTHGSYTVDKLTLCDGSEVHYVSCNEAEKKIASNKASSLCDVFEQRSDLVPTVYEGGMKIWEGSVDLVQHLCESKVELHNKAVLELGCGAGLPGLLATKEGAVVHFQDYNEEVLRHLTIPNVFLNGGEEVLRKCRFYTGDWASLQSLLTSGNPGQKYDVILTAETIYSPDSHKDLHNVFCSLLSSSGVVYLAAKVYYFGVGGGIREFEDLINKEGILTSNVVKAIDEGVQREILEIKFKNIDLGVAAP